MQNTSLTICFLQSKYCPSELVFNKHTCSLLLELIVSRQEWCVHGNHPEAQAASVQSGNKMRCCTFQQIRKCHFNLLNLEFLELFLIINSTPCSLNDSYNKMQGQSQEAEALEQECCNASVSFSFQTEHDCDCRFLCSTPHGFSVSLSVFLASP